jgi:hypothetical protein
LGGDGMKKLILLFALVSLFGCASIKPMELPKYNPPDLSSITRPVIPKPVEGKDFIIDVEKGTVTYTISGQNLLREEAISERTAWQTVKMLKQLIDIQTEIIKQKDELIIVIDLKRQYAERGKTYADVEKYASWIISLIAIALTLAR